MGLALVGNLLFAGLCGAAVMWFAWLTLRTHKQEIAWLRGRVDYYQKRGDIALDRLVSLAAHMPIDTTPRGETGAPITAETLEQEVRRMVQGDHEVIHAGHIE